ncbi:hypothetical protein AALO_G00047080 [Alosa alosa]|uniref:Transposase n=1 Tax=Alosa alosa TaxID=278164 RepID=A0AAV6H6Q7_9TELE|nr:hypothetical protein AALO_G00047080 [Alosa alosa]
MEPFPGEAHSAAVDLTNSKLMGRLLGLTERMVEQLFPLMKHSLVFERWKSYANHRWFSTQTIKNTLMSCGV